MRARLAIHAAGVEVELREILLRDKPEAFLKVSPSKTVPCLVTDNEIIDESLDIMKWVLAMHDPDDWLDMPEQGWHWIALSDGPFKEALDRTKYSNRYPGVDPLEQRAIAARFLTELDAQIKKWIFDHPTIADFAILPFVRQFAFIDKAWFDAKHWPNLQEWLERFIASKQFEEIMPKYAPWQEGDPPLKIYATKKAEPVSTN